MGKYVYMKVTKDRYELPLVVADSVLELARMLGVDRGSIYKCLKRAKHGSKSQYLKILVEEE